MTLPQRIENVLLGLGMIAGALILALVPEDGFFFIVCLMALGMLLRSAKQLFYYFTMAIHMVGGKIILFEGVIFLDLAVFTISLAGVKSGYIMLYLLIGYLFAGAIDLLRARESKKLNAPAWKFKCFQGIFNIALAVAGFFFLQSEIMPVYLYAAGLFWNGINRIVRSFRRTAIVYIP